MYTPKHFNEDDPEILQGLMRNFSFALLVTARDGAPVGTHIPLHVESDGANGRLLGHVARANDHWRQFDGETEAMAVFQGPHAYISPNWYANDGLVPTWNYATVHAYGRPRFIEDAGETTDILWRLVSANESDATGNWSMDRLSKDAIAAQIKGIVAFEMTIDRLEGKFKMSQNRPAEDARGAANGVRALGGGEAEMVAAEMEARVKAE
ncbi:MAG: FMN-binding negative transcriptional regulator [Rhodospirillaceae bacterium]|jgi:transcriptional regulator|nr:FMN-binding negative transcriptional regulator [Rhodospirillaceae bacterium]MBT5299020.1 FMN-binding negative transcriptional regulator [Rhodospirillaceae bacterium]MBT5514915.1 FMN-binding negative transcriptional regulator [Rhodospirillaceae bacterium]MBT6086131.1 FMN-binding negative transcriptional regulator [Rhodospirillaceae bacterium]MBT6883423.1 FMN-binding negative transcriptional regulator [Rhodospirillaceae bacterium]